MTIKEFLDKQVPVGRVLVAVFAAAVTVGAGSALYSRAEGKRAKANARAVAEKEKAKDEIIARQKRDLSEGQEKIFRRSELIDRQDMEIASLKAQARTSAQAGAAAEIHLISYGVSPKAIPEGEKNGLLEKVLEQNAALRKDNLRLRTEVIGPPLSKLRLVPRLKLERQ
jgi:hypothetical protein